jgi:hypothetical protein
VRALALEQIALGSEGVSAAVAGAPSTTSRTRSFGCGNVSPEAPEREALVETLDDVSARIAEGEIEIPCV